MATLLWIVLGIIALIILYLVFLYNSFVRMRYRADEAWADIEVQLKRRHNLIPNLISTVKGYAKHERETLDKVTQARTQALQAKTPGERQKAENFLTSTLKTLFALAESYPDLKANVNFLELQRELSDTEDKIQAARRFYNTQVRDYNTMMESFPAVLFAGSFGFKPKELFKIKAEQIRAVPKVKF
jgi:LemA protein